MEAFMTLEPTAKMSEVWAEKKEVCQVDGQTFSTQPPALEQEEEKLP